MKFINFSRSNNPSEIHVGCLHGNLCLDVSDAIQHNVLKFPAVSPESKTSCRSSPDWSLSKISCAPF